MDAIDLLKQDHDAVKDLLRQVTSMGEGQPEEKRRLAEKIVREMMVHERIEEDLFYPAFRKAADEKGKDLVAESKEEHHVVDTIMDELQGVELDAREFDAKLKVLKENVEHHIKEEEDEMFPQARKILAGQLDQLGQDMKELKESLRREAKPKREQSA